MKTITLVRHAKSGWDDPDMSDIDRTLNPRGMKDAPAMAKFISEKLNTPNLIISSPAVRAMTTAKFFANAFNIDEDEIDFDLGIYERGAKYILRKLTGLDNKLENIILFGHNPDITSLAAYLCGDYFESVPTCSVVSINFNIDTWQDIENKNGTLNFYEYPKKSLKS